MTPLQARVLTYIEDYITANRAAPTQRQIANALGTSVSSVSRMVDCLERDGFLRRRVGCARSIRLVPDASQQISAAFLSAAVEIAGALDIGERPTDPQLMRLLAAYQRDIKNGPRPSHTGRTRPTEGDENQWPSN